MSAFAQSFRALEADHPRATLAKLGAVCGLLAAWLFWFALGAVSVRLFGFTPGQFALGLMVVPVDGRQHVGFGRAVVRGVLIAVVIPPLITDADLRGLQDKVTNTAVVRR